MPINIIDIVFLVLLVAFGIRGAMRGLIAELAGIIGIVVGFLLARAFTPMFIHYLTPHIAENAAGVIVFTLIFVTGLLLVGLLARLLQAVLKVAFASWLDYTFGFCIGIAKAFLLCVLLAYGLAMLIPHFDMVRDSVGVPIFLNALKTLIAWSGITFPLPMPTLLPY